MPILSRIQQNRQHLVPLFLTIIALLYLVGVRQQFLYVNIDRFQTDQSAYLEAAKSLKTSNYTVLTDRNRMPVYPFLLSLLYESGLSDEAFFARGKLLNIGLSLLTLPILFWIFRQYLPLFTAVNLILIHAFTLYIFKAAYVQAELLFYLFNFAGFLLLCRLLWQPAWPTAVSTGILLGVAHLTKASILPGLLLFGGTAVLQAIFRRFWQRPSPPQLRQFLLDLTIPALVILFFLLTIWPYIQNSKEHFGHYFYNVNSTFYIWYDHWEEVETGTKAYGDRSGWPDMPPDEVPSATKYFREHSTTQIFERFFNGLLVILITTTNSYGYLIYFCLLFGLVLSLVIVNRQQTMIIIKKYPFISLFVSGFFGAYSLLYAWYWPISSGNRFVLALFTPIMFTLAFLLYRLFEPQLSLKLSRHSQTRINLGQLLNWIMITVLLVDLYIILTVRIGVFYGGF
ncbi:MAG: hypothetical protein CL608_03340 [Anaerolineaceae bacterium]|nr:hypothetical protein [Anaerolineaceae bacterium]